MPTLPRRTPSCVFALAFLLVPLALRAQTQVELVNTTDHCVWITMMHGMPVWAQIKASDDGRKNTGPLWVKGHASYIFELGSTPDLRVRAEVQQNNNCKSGEIGKFDTGGNIHDTHITYESLQGKPGRIRIALKKGQGSNFYLEEQK